MIHKLKFKATIVSIFLLKKIPLIHELQSNNIELDFRGKCYSDGQFDTIFKGDSYKAIFPKNFICYNGIDEMSMQIIGMISFLLKSKKI